MAVIDTQALLVRPLAGAMIRRYRLGAAANVGESIFMATDGDVEPTDGDVQASAQARGIIVAIGTNGKVAGVANDMVDVVVHGPVEMGNVTPMTPGGAVYPSPAAGKMDQSASAVTGDFNAVIGWAESTTAIFVDPQSGPATVV